jgi:protein-tyrosine-phosphatase
MAEGFAKHFVDPGKEIEILSAGTQPASQVNPLAIEVMREVGIDISGNQPKMLTPQMIKKTTHFLSMGCGVQESCPVPLFSTLIEDWELEDPAGKDIAVFRAVRDQIRAKVINLLRQLDALRDNYS